MPLRAQLAQCEQDTRNAIGVGAAVRLAAWRRYQTNEQLVQFIQRAIRNEENRATGWLLGSQKLISLESIVLNNPALFTVDDIRISTATLGR